MIVPCRPTAMHYGRPEIPASFASQRPRQSLRPVTLSRTALRHHGRHRWRRPGPRPADEAGLAAARTRNGECGPAAVTRRRQVVPGILWLPSTPLTGAARPGPRRHLVDLARAGAEAVKPSGRTNWSWWPLSICRAARAAALGTGRWPAARPWLPSLARIRPARPRCSPRSAAAPLTRSGTPRRASLVSDWPPGSPVEVGVPRRCTGTGTRPAPARPPGSTTCRTPGCLPAHLTRSDQMTAERRRSAACDRVRYAAAARTVRACLRPAPVPSMTWRYTRRYPRSGRHGPAWAAPCSRGRCHRRGRPVAGFRSPSVA